MWSDASLTCRRQAPLNRVCWGCDATPQPWRGATPIKKSAEYARSRWMHHHHAKKSCGLDGIDSEGTGDYIYDVTASPTIRWTSRELGIKLVRGCQALTLSGGRRPISAAAERETTENQIEREKFKVVWGLAPLSR